MLCDARKERVFRVEAKEGRRAEVRVTSFPLMLGRPEARNVPALYRGLDDV